MLVIKIDTGDTHIDDFEFALVRILHDLAHRLERGADFSRAKPIYDINNAYVGRVQITQEDPITPTTTH